jgi:hypothetical protein
MKLSTTSGTVSLPVARYQRGTQFVRDFVRQLTD